MNLAFLSKATQRLGEAVIDPTLWPDLMEEICRHSLSKGAVLLQTDRRTPDVPRTESLAEAMDGYFRDGWHLRDGRSRCIPMLKQGAQVIVDQDILTMDDIRRSEFYNDCLIPSDSPWFAAVGFQAGDALWVMSLQRSARQGSFSDTDKRVLSTLGPRLTEAATLSDAVGRAVLHGMTGALNLVLRPALALDRLGKVLDANASCHALFDDHFRVHKRNLVIQDAAARASFERMKDQMKSTLETETLQCDPILVRRGANPPILLQALPVSGAARSPFLGARVILLASAIAPPRQAGHTALRASFGLTLAEARLASLLATGMPLDDAAPQLGIARETARNQLKAVFAKTNTRRQAELVALIVNL